MTYKIALLSAFIGNSNNLGNAGNTGELKIAPAAQAEFDRYGVTVYRFNNNNLDILLPHVVPALSKDIVVHETWYDRWVYWYYEHVKYKQTHRPVKEVDYARLVAKIPKMLFYKVVPTDYDFYVWLDSKFTINSHWLDYLLWLINKYSQSDLIVSKHSVRSSVEEETKDMLKMMKLGYGDLHAKYYAPDLAFQLYKYQQISEFVDNRLCELGMIVYSSKMLAKKQFAEEWYAHNCYYTIQDQISFPYLCQKHHIKVAAVCQDVSNMPFAIHEYGN